MPQSKLLPGLWLELIPLAIGAGPGLVLVGYVEYVDWPNFGFNYADGHGLATGSVSLFRLDENSEFAVRETDQALFEVGRMRKMA